MVDVTSVAAKLLEHLARLEPVHARRRVEARAQQLAAVPREGQARHALQRNERETRMRKTNRRISGRHKTSALKLFRPPLSHARLVSRRGIKVQSAIQAVDCRILESRHLKGAVSESKGKSLPRFRRKNRD